VTTGGRPSRLYRCVGGLCEWCVPGIARGVKMVGCRVRRRAAETRAGRLRVPPLAGLAVIAVRIPRAYALGYYLAPLRGWDLLCEIARGDCQRLGVERHCGDDFGGLLAAWGSLRHWLTSSQWHPEHVGMSRRKRFLDETIGNGVLGSACGILRAWGRC
jgi:hypothetical protein